MVIEPYEAKLRRGGAAALKEASAFLFGDDTAYRTLVGVTRRLREAGIRYSVAGDLALVAHGHACTTLNISVLVTPEGLAAAHRALHGLEYVPTFTGGKNLRDMATGLRIEFLTTGGFPGDGKPKPVMFPGPAAVAEEIDGIRYVGLPALGGYCGPPGERPR